MLHLHPAEININILMRGSRGTSTKLVTLMTQENSMKLGQGSQIGCQAKVLHSEIDWTLEQLPSEVVTAQA